MSFSLVARLRRWMRGLMLRYMPMMITCRAFDNFILSYLDDELTEKQRRTFEFHLRVCRECRDYLTAYKRTIEISKRAFEHSDSQIPCTVPDDLIRAILAAKDA